MNYIVIVDYYDGVTTTKSFSQNTIKLMNMYVESMLENEDVEAVVIKKE